MSSFKMDDRGFKAFLMSPELGRAALGVAQQLAGQANQSGRSSYTAVSMTVSGGRRNEPRAGAEVQETRRSWSDVRARHLRNVTLAFRARGGGL